MAKKKTTKDTVVETPVEVKEEPVKVKEDKINFEPIIQVVNEIFEKHYMSNKELGTKAISNHLRKMLNK